MSKLDGNERWNAKMLLTEHQEKYDDRQEEKRQEGKQEEKRQSPRAEELKLIRDYILLPHLLTMVQRDMDEINRSQLLLKRMYQDVTQTLMNRISKDAHTLRQELSRRSIKIVADEQIDSVLYYSYVCRGYEHKFAIVRDVMRSEMRLKLTAYVAEICAASKT